jgi:tetratricopeptide (TPR) repeat protein
MEDAMSEHELWNELGNLYFLSGAYGQAVLAYRRSIEMDGTFGRPYSNLALTYVQQGRFADALDLYHTSIQLLAENSEKALTWNRLGNVYRYLKDYRSALFAFQHADELDPEHRTDVDQAGFVPETGPAAALTHADRPTPTLETSTVEASAGNPLPDLGGEVTQEDGTASWAVAEMRTYQEDMASPPKLDPLTTWGDPNFQDDDLDRFLPSENETEIQAPDADGDDLSRWLPMPEEVPQDALLEPVEVEEDDFAAIEVDDFGDFEDYEIDENLPEASEVVAAGLSLDTPDEAAHPVEPQPVNATFTEILLPVAYKPEPAARYEYAEKPVQADVIVDVEERPSPEFIVADQPPMAAAIEPPALQAGVVSEPAPEQPHEDMAGGPTATVEREAEELQQIEADIAKYNRVVQINPRNAHAWDTLGNLYKSAGRYSEALLAYQQAVSNDPAKSLYHHHLGLLYACEGRLEDAICAFQRVIEIDPGHSLAHATLGGYYRKMGLEELAQKHIGKAMKSIFDSENEYNRACLAAICGNADEALNLLRVALKNKQTYVDWILRDPDLDFVRQDPRFKQLISDYTR